MNNNNLYNTNNFIGTTHNDYFKTASNALSKAINSLELNSSNYTSNVSNILNTNITNVSNILNTNSSNYTLNTSNYIISRYDPMIETKSEDILLPIPATLNHTYISNSNVAGEIRFWCKSTSSYPVIIPLGVPNFRVKIDVDGKLKVYYTYDPLINATFGNGWVDVGNSIAGLNASDANMGAAIAALEIQTTNNFTILQQEIEVLIIQLNCEDVIDDAQQASIEYSLETFRTEYFNDLTNTNVSSLLNIPRNIFNTGTTAYASRCAAAIAYKITQNPIVSSFLGIGGIAFAFAFAAGQNLAFGNYYLNQLKKEFTTSNINTTPTRKLEILQLIEDTKIDNFMDYCSNMSNMTISQGYINTYNTDIQYIPNLSTSNLYINTGNLNKLVASSSISENGVLISNKYLTSNHLYNLTYNYSSERQYPSKLYSSIQSEDIVSLLGKLVYRNILYLDNTSISYGSGFYEVYSSSTYDTPTTKNKLFNYNTTETTNTPRWAIAQYNSGTGNYVADNSIDNVYYGDWVIIKMPNQILLTRYRIYRNTSFTERAPAEWKIYGSNDGITFTEITEASQMSRLISLNYTNNYYDKTLANTFTIQYQYFGFVFNKLLSTAGETSLNFAELQIFGKEIISNSITSNIYCTSNAVKGIVEFEMPIVCKHKAFYCRTETLIYPNLGSVAYYKYDIDMRNYTTTGYIQIGSQSNDPYRIFRIRAFLGSCYFSALVNGLPNILHYEIYMSYKANAASGGQGAAGVNIFSIGVPNNPNLNIIPPNNIFILSNPFNDFNYITLVSTVPADIRVIIEDLIS